MAGLTAAQLREYQRLLREGRVTEADRMMETAARELDSEEQAARLQQEAKSPKTLPELELAFKQQVCAVLGNPPRLASLLTEIEGFAKPEE